MLRNRLSTYQSVDSEEPRYSQVMAWWIYNLLGNCTDQSMRNADKEKNNEHQHNANQFDEIANSRNKK